MAKKYRDQPRYPLINKYEDDFKRNWSSIMKLGLKDFEEQLKKLIIKK